MKTKFMIDVYLKNVNDNCRLLDDNNLFHALIFAKKSTEGGIGPEDFSFLEETRKKLGIDSQIVFAGLLEKIKLIYFRHYFQRRKN